MSESKKIRDWRENCQKVVQYGEWTSKVQRYKEVVAEKILRYAAQITILSLLT